MYWKIKAAIQNAVSLLPSSASYAAYYQIQRHFGSLQHLDPISTLVGGIQTWKLIQKQGHDPLGGVFFEVGTGRVPIIPVAYWLMGAKKTFTVDLNPYLKAELVAEALNYLAENKEKVLSLFGPLINTNRFDELLKFEKNYKFNISDFLDLCSIDYMAPGNAADTNLLDQSIDFHTSYTVFEHIPLNVLKSIIEEGNRIIKNDGLFIHRIDYSDHFSHSDSRISAINFLQYSDTEWKKYANNRYMYMNRLRHDDFIDLFKSTGQSIVYTETSTEQRLKYLLKNGEIDIDERFNSKSTEILEIISAWIITIKNE